MIRAYKYRLLPNKRQHRALLEILEAQRQLFNAALQERIDCYRKTGKGRSLIDQQKSLTICRRELPEMAALPANLQRWTLKRLNDAYLSFYQRRRIQKGKSGLPRYRSFVRWRSFGFLEFSGIRFDGKRLRFAGLPGGLRVHLHRALPKDADIRGCTFTRNIGGWSIGFLLAVEAPEKCAITSAIGIDLGIKTFGYCSDGTTIPNPIIARRANQEMRRRQRAVARCKQGSKRRNKMWARVKREFRKIGNTRRTWLHQKSRALVNRTDLIIVEDLNFRALATSVLGPSIKDMSWSTFIDMLSYKAEEAGKTLLKVDPNFTTQECSGCGLIVKKDLAERTHSCPECKLILHRDHNAARNILRRGVVAAGLANVAQWGERRAGNLISISR